VVHLQTAVLHHIDARRHQLGSGGVIADAALQPHSLGRGGDEVVDVPIHVRAPARAALLSRHNRNHQVCGLAKQGAASPSYRVRWPQPEPLLMSLLPLPTCTWTKRRSSGGRYLRKTVTMSSVFESGTSATVRYTGCFRM
jgi:hypothetical protein